MKLNLNIWQATTALLGVVCLLFAWRLDNANATIEQMRQAQTVAEAQANTAKSVTEKNWREQVSDAEKEAQNHAQSTEESYQKALSTMDLNPGVVSSRGMPNGAEGGNRAEMPRNTPAPLGVSTSSTQCPRADTKQFQKLYQEQLRIARDCDITTQHYNELLKLWDKLRRTNDPS